MDKREQKMVLERFLLHHGIELLTFARANAYAKRVQRFFPALARASNPDEKPWRAPLVAHLAEQIAKIDPASVKKDETARPFFVAKKYRKKVNRAREFLFSGEWRELRFEVLRERGRQCECCGAKPPDVRIEVDHIKPTSKRWDLRLDKNNLQVLCRACNHGKGNRSADDFRAEKSGIGSQKRVSRGTLALDRSRRRSATMFRMTQPILPTETPEIPDKPVGRQHALTRWRNRKGLSFAKFGNLVGASKSMVLRWEAGQIPTPLYMIRIMAVTKREVTANDWYDL